MYILKTLTDKSDARIFENLTRLRPGDSFWASCVKNMLISATEEGITDRQSALLVLGKRFRVALGNKIAPWEPDEVNLVVLNKFYILMFRSPHNILSEIVFAFIWIRTMKSFIVCR